MALEEQTRAIVRMTDFVLAGSEPFDHGTASGRFRIRVPDRPGLPVTAGVEPLDQSMIWRKRSVRGLYR